MTLALLLAVCLTVLQNILPSFHEFDNIASIQYSNGTALVAQYRGSGLTVERVTQQGAVTGSFTVAGKERRTWLVSLNDMAVDARRQRVSAARVLRRTDGRGAESGTGRVPYGPARVQKDRLPRAGFLRGRALAVALGDELGQRHGYDSGRKNPSCATYTTCRRSLRAGRRRPRAAARTRSKTARASGALGRWVRPRRTCPARASCLCPMKTAPSPRRIPPACSTA